VGSSFVAGSALVDDGPGRYSPAARLPGADGGRPIVRDEVGAGRAAAGARSEVVSDEIIECFVEVPMGSRNKYEYDFERRTFHLDRMLFTAVRYPGDYGFIPETLALDGDHLDVVCVLGEPTFPGCTIRARVLGMLDMSDDKGPDEKILAVADMDPRWKHLRFLHDVPDHLLEEIAHFFAIYKDLEQKLVEVRGWRNREEALRIIQEAHERYEGPVEAASYPD
jgi:inorganic pyrophosphatase